MKALTPRSNWNLEVLVFVDARKLENPDTKTWSNDGEYRNQTQVTDEGGMHLHTVPLMVPIIFLNVICFYVNLLY